MTGFNDFMPVLPEIILAFLAITALMLGVFYKGDTFKLVTLFAGISLVCVGVVAIVGSTGQKEFAFNDLLVVDSFGLFMKLLILIGGVASLSMAGPYLRFYKLDKFEFPVLVMLAIVGMMIMVSAGGLLTLYLGLELQSLALYVLASINRDRYRSTEAGLKYFVLGALSSGMLLYGISLIYGFTGTIDFAVLSESLESGEKGIGLTVGLVFVLTGLCFKISAVPFHMWTPDVYEGAPTPVTAFFAAAPKVAALGLMIRVLADGFWELRADWQQIIIFVSIASMLVGAFLAIVQTNIKRLMAYSSIGHIGYALVGLAAGSEAGIESMLIYIAIYLTMTLGTFGGILAMRRDEGMVEDITELAGLAKTNLPLAVAFGIFMFSLAGIPPLLGFWGKWYVFSAAIEAGLLPLVIIGLVTSVVSAYYYLRVIKVIFFDSAEENFKPIEGTGVKLVIGLSALANSPFSYFILVAPLTAAAGWAIGGLIT